MKKIRWLAAQFFEKLWWKNYLKKKQPEVYLNWKKNYWSLFLDEIGINLSETKKALDVGCGPAGIFILSAESQAQWKALDPLLNDYKQLDIFNIKHYPQVSFENISFESFQEQQQYDTIFCINAINHFISLKENFQKLQQLLATEGKLILSTDAHNYRFLKYILYWLPLDILHPHQYTEAEYSNMIQQSGFEIVSKKRKHKAFIFSYYVYVLKKKAIP